MKNDDFILQKYDLMIYLSKYPFSEI